MPGSIKIQFRINGNYEKNIKLLEESGVHFDKNLEELQTQLDAIDKKRTKANVKTQVAKAKLDQLSAQYIETLQGAEGGVVDSKQLKNLETANRQYERMRRNVELLDNAAGKTEKSMRDTSGELSKIDSRAGKVLSAFSSSGAADIVGALGTNLVKAAAGDDAGTLFASTFSGALAGAQLGSVIPVIGTAVGTVVGGIAGLMNGEFQIQGKQDEQFNQIVKNHYEGFMAGYQEDVTQGSSIAAQRELDVNEFARMFGDKGQAEYHLDWARYLADTTPISYDDLKLMSRALGNFTLSVDEMQEYVQTIGTAGVALNLSSQNMGVVATTLARMKESGVTTTEDISLLQQNGIDAAGILGDSFGEEAVAEGEIDGGKAVKVILRDLTGYTGEMKEQSNTFSGQMETMQGFEAHLQAAMGESHNSALQGSIERRNALIDPNSELGHQLEQGYALMGKTQGELEASEIDSKTEALTAVLGSTKYEEALEAGDGNQVRELLAQADVVGSVLYHARTEYDEFEDSQIKIIDQLQEILAPHWEKYGERIAQEMSKGIKETYPDEMVVTPDGVVYFVKKTPSYSSIVEPLRNLMQKEDKPNVAYGLSYVPYNGYPARLHEGERVLTASEARAYNSGGGGVTIPKLADTIVVREDADIDRITLALVSKLREAQMVS